MHQRESIKYRLDNTEEQVGDLENRIVEITPLKIAKRKKNFFKQKII